MNNKTLIKEILIIVGYLIIICSGLSLGGFHVYHIGWINEAQLGYLGAIIGGGITLLGVVITILHTNNIREKDKQDRNKERILELSAQYRPILKLTIPKDPKEKKIIVRNEDPNYLYLNISLNLENIGRGEAINITTNTSPAFDFEGLNISVCSEFEKLLITGTELECLPANEKRQLMIQVITNKIYETHDVISFYINFEYYDAFSNEKKLKHSVKVVIRNNENLEFLKINSEEKYGVNIQNVYKN